MVVLKQIRQSHHPYEVEISMYFSSDALKSVPRNHCVPVYKVLDVQDNPDLKLLVMPLLRAFNDPHMDTIREAMEFFRQTFEVSSHYHSPTNCAK